MDPCAKENAFTLDKIILETSVATLHGKEIRLLNLSLWTPAYRTPFLGTCYGGSCLMLGEQMFISFVLGFENSFKALIYLFDPKLFLPKRDSSIIPFLLLDNLMSKAFYLK